MRPLGGVGILLLALAAATLAHANGAQDGEAGLAALKRGADDEAIRLFTRAIASGDLAPDDQEFAYLNRGKAYLARAMALPPSPTCAWPSASSPTTPRPRRACGRRRGAAPAQRRARWSEPIRAGACWRGDGTPLVQFWRSAGAAS